MYRKPTHTNRVLAFDSHHPVSAKRSVVLALFGRLNSHYSEEPVKEEIKKLHTSIPSLVLMGILTVSYGAHYSRQKGGKLSKIRNRSGSRRMLW